MTNKPSRSVTRCIVCRASFGPKRKDAKYCSPACRQQAHRARLDMGHLNRKIEQARLRYWELIAQKAHALGRAPSQIVTDESQYVDSDGNVWMGGVLGRGPWRMTRPAGKTTPSRPKWDTWGLEAAGPPWAPPGPERGEYETQILGTKGKRAKL